jgi:anthranilate synthase/aminodeoxychorismate synthase-like glutamine amidotransferase
MMEIAFIDHYDSFSFNVIDWLRSSTDGRVDVQHLYYDDCDAMQGLLKRPRPVVLSPGPKAPDDAPQTLEIVNSLLEKSPILGICLGHQMICKVFGGRLLRCTYPSHGEARDTLILRQEGIFRGLPPRAKFASYNSLCVDPESLPNSAEILAETLSGELQAVRFETQSGNPVIGLQFHPESFLSDYGKVIVENWLKMLPERSEGSRRLDF